ncbi:MAG: class I SAM-dependent methyltransferase [Acidobacteriota bacterium]
MSAKATRAARANYGIDAPGVVRNLFIAGISGLLIAGGAAIAGTRLRLAIPVGSARLVFPVASMAVWIGLGCTAMGCWMLWSSTMGKVRERERLLDRIDWTGSERVLDVGCGRGLLLIGAAKRLTTGSASGIDLWQAEDLSGNRPEATLENARREGVAERVDVKTADMRQIPFPDATFDVIVSRAAIHNLYQASDRAQAIGEIARVLKPGGRALIEDIRHGRQYAAEFERHGCGPVQSVGSPLVSLFLAVVTWGSLRPAILLARKSGGLAP